MYYYYPMPKKKQKKKTRKKYAAILDRNEVTRPSSQTQRVRFPIYLKIVELRDTDNLTDRQELRGIAKCQLSLLYIESSALS